MIADEDYYYASCLGVHGVFQTTSSTLLCLQSYSKEVPLQLALVVFLECSLVHDKYQLRNLKKNSVILKINKAIVLLLFFKTYALAFHFKITYVLVRYHSFVVICLPSLLPLHTFVLDNSPLKQLPHFHWFWPVYSNCN